MSILPMNNVIWDLDLEDFVTTTSPSEHENEPSATQDNGQSEHGNEPSAIQDNGQPFPSEHGNESNAVQGNGQNGEAASSSSSDNLKRKLDAIYDIAQFAKDFANMSDEVRPRNCRQRRFLDYCERICHKDATKQIQKVIPLLLQTLREDYNLETTIASLSCSICYAHYDDDGRKPVVLKCRHMFCIQCIESLETNEVVQCPKCRKTTSGWGQGRIYV